MKAKKTGLMFLILMISIASSAQLQIAYSDVLDRNDIITRTGNNDEAKTYVLEIKAKIAQEREAIIAAGKRLKDAKKTGDKAAIDQIKKEVDQEIKDRKATIRSLYDDIKNKINQQDSFIPGRKDRKIK